MINSNDTDTNLDSEIESLYNLYYLATCRKAAIAFISSIVLLVILLFCLPDIDSWQVLTIKALTILAYFACILFLLINDTFYDIAESVKNVKTTKI